jgi:hypothetical protein
MRRTPLTTLLAAAVLMTAACGGTADEPGTGSPMVTDGPASPEPTPGPSPEPTVDPSPSPTAAPTDPAGSPVVNGPNTITAPLPGSTVPGPEVVVTGEGTAFEATLNYRVLRADDETVVEQGFPMAGANGEVGPWTIELGLEPGRYTVEVWEPDMSDGASGEGPFRNLVATTFTVG